jgi:pyrimidine-nucleoside phosphorylase
MDAAAERTRQALASGEGLRKLQQVIELQGGDPRVCDDASRLPRARDTALLRADRDGRVARIACRAVGHAAMLLGAGRETVTSAIDPGVGLVLHKKVGDLVMEGETLVTVHLNDRRREGEVLALLKAAFTLAAEAPVRKPMIQAVLD